MKHGDLFNMVIVDLGISGMQLIKNHPIRCYDVDLVLIARVSKYGHAKAKVCQNSEAEKKNEYGGYKWKWKK